MIVSTLRASCFACHHLIDGRSAADYVGSKLERFHPSCLAAKKARKITSPQTDPKSVRAYYDWRHRSRARQLISLAVGLRRLKRKGARGLVFQDEADRIGLPSSFRVGGR